MPRGTRPTAIVAVTVRVARSTTDTLLPPRFVIQSSVPRGCTATPHGPSPTATVTVTVPVARFTRETVSSRKLLTAAIAKLLRQATVSGAVGASQRPAWQVSSPLHTSPSLQLVPSGSIWQVGEQQSLVADRHGDGHGAGREIHQGDRVVAEVADGRDREVAPAGDGLGRRRRLAASSVAGLLPVAHVAIAAAGAVGVDLAGRRAAVARRRIAVVARFSGRRVDDPVSANGGRDGGGGRRRAGRRRYRRQGGG